MAYNFSESSGEQRFYWLTGIIFAALSDWSDRYSGGECGVGGIVLGLVVKGRRHSELNAPHAGTHQRPDLQQLRRMVPHEALANWVCLRPMRRRAQIST